MKENVFFRALFFKAQAEKGIAWHIDASSRVWTLIYHGKLANQIARLAAIVVKKEFSFFKLVLSFVGFYNWLQQKMNALHIWHFCHSFCHRFHSNRNWKSGMLFTSGKRLRQKLILTDYKPSARAALGNIGPRSWQYAPSAASSVQRRPRANIAQYGSSEIG